MKTFVFKNLLRTSLLAFILVLPNTLLAQAGSSLPIVFESPQAFFASVSLEMTISSGVQGVPLRPKGFLKIPQDEQFVF